MPEYETIQSHSVVKRHILTSEQIISQRYATVDRSATLDRNHLTLFHDEAYVSALESGEPFHLASSGGIWFPEIYQLCLSTAGSAVAAVDEALDKGYSGVVGGGGHHAGPGLGGALSYINDPGIAVRHLQTKGRHKIIVIDLDLHYGNGTVKGLANETDVFLFDYHALASNYMIPATKHHFRTFNSASGARMYRESLAKELPEVLDRFKPDFAIYIAGMDIVAGTPNGQLDFRHDDIATRERLVFDNLVQRNIKAIYFHAGGYLAPEVMAQYHLLTAKALYESTENPSSERVLEENYSNNTLTGEWAVIADIHGDYNRLSAVLADIDRRRIHNIICLGDLIENPDWEKNDDVMVLEEVRDRGIVCVKGNHDELAKYLNVPDELAGFLSKLPEFISYDGVHFTHVTPRAKKLPISNSCEAWNAMIESGHKIVFVGHVHIPYIFSNESGMYGQADMLKFQYGQKMALQRDYQYVISVGPVGYSRDMIDQPRYAVYNADDHSLEMVITN